MGSTNMRRELVGIALTVFAIFLFGALFLQREPSGARSCLAAVGAFGPVGTIMRCGLLVSVGMPAAVLIALLPLVHALRLFGRMESSTDRSWLVFLGGVVALLPVALAHAMTVGREFHPLTGLWGAFTAYYVSQAFGVAGAWFVILLLFSALTAMTLSWNPIRALVGHRSPVVRPDAGATAVDGASRAALLEPTPEEMPALDLSLANRPLEAIGDDMPPRERKKKERKTKAGASAEHAAQVAAEIDATGDATAETDEELPPVELLASAPPRNTELGRRELDAAGVKLMEALLTFNVKGVLVGRTTGPSVTQFEIEPAPGVKVRQIANLASDLALAMRAQSIRIVAPIPGKGAVGVEVPNPNPEIVAFREMLDSREYQQARAALPIALGKDLEGRVVVADLAKMPHLLIAGATGSGKSVCVNTIITSLVYRHTPRTLRFLMVDPKMVELSVYNKLPHLRHKVITDNRDAAAVLKWALLEMQERYELLAANACRNMQDFNRRVQDGAPLQMPKRPDVAFENRVYTGGILPYIVVVIEEMADLMMTVQGEVETPIAMLAQKARAIGIHLLLATQRPSVNVITGLIKANFPSRIAFRVASQIDSRTIIDGAGAEALLGNGDMLFIPPGKSEPSRIQGAYISSEDTERLMHWYDERKDARRQAIAAQGLAVDEPASDEPDILEAVRQREAIEKGGDDDDGADAADRDKLFREAAEAVIQNQGGSTSLLQRRLRIGYGRAARIIDQLHAAGVLGPPDGSKPRDVLMGLEDLDRISERR